MAEMLDTLRDSGVLVMLVDNLEAYSYSAIHLDLAHRQ
jgi:hypothetical protein